jgi:hypothetical protein
MSDYEFPREVYQSGPFSRRVGGFDLGETGEITAKRGYRDSTSDDLGQVAVSAWPDLTLTFDSRAEVERYRDWMTKSLNAAADAAFGGGNFSGAVETHEAS